MPVQFDTENRNKRSLALDLEEAARRRSRRRGWSRNAQVVIEGFRPGVAKRLGIDYETLRKQ